MAALGWLLNLGFAGGEVVVPLLTGGDTGYLYATPTATEPTLVATPAAAAPSLTVGPAGSDDTYTYGPS